MEGPILFSTAMVQAIFEDRKLKTRRVVKPQPSKGITGYPYHRPDGLWIWTICGGVGVSDPFKCPYGKPGDILWVRETWKYYEKAVGYGESFHVKKFLAYKADEDNAIVQKSCEWYEGNWRPSIFMPREACRLKLKITDIRIERLQDITIEDICKEGIETDCRDCIEHNGDCNNPRAADDECGLYDDTFMQFEKLWDGINKKRGLGWDINPWVWVISFERVNL